MTYVLCRCDWWKAAWWLGKHSDLFNLRDGSSGHRSCLAVAGKQGSLCWRSIRSEAFGTSHPPAALNVLSLAFQQAATIITNRPLGLKYFKVTSLWRIYWKLVLGFVFLLLLRLSDKNNRNWNTSVFLNKFSRSFHMGYRRDISYLPECCNKERRWWLEKPFPSQPDVLFY